MTDLQNIDPQTREQNKTHEQRGEDFAYTLNHAISCGMTDLVTGPLLAAAWEATTGKEPPAIIGGCVHDHDHSKHDHGHGHTHHDHGHSHPHDHGKASWWGKVRERFNWKSFKHHWKEYMKGEVAGDVAAVPLTIMVQRFAPGLMEGIRQAIEPVLGGFFRRGAHSASLDMARKAGLSPDAPEVKAREQEIYEHEVSHLPQAVMWNVFAFPISILIQLASGGHFKNQGWKKELGHIATVKTGGAIISNTVLIGGRMLAPEHANKLDSWQSQNVITPVARGVGGLFGMDQRTFDRIEEKEKRMRGDDWQEQKHGKPVAKAEHADQAWGTRMQQEAAEAGLADKQR